MAHVDCTKFFTQIEAPAEEAFAVMTNFRAWSTWTRAIRGAWARSEGPLREGFRFAMKTTASPLPLPLTVVELEDNRRIAWRAKSFLVTITHRIEFETLGPNRCMVRNHEYAEGVLGDPVGRLLTQPIDRFDRQWAADLAARFAASGVGAQAGAPGARY